MVAFATDIHLQYYEEMLQSTCSVLKKNDMLRETETFDCMNDME